jgi:hypothetical protein
MKPLFPQVVLALTLALALAAGCTESGTRTGTPAPDPMTYRANAAAGDLGFFVPSGVAKPYVVYGEATEQYKNDRVVPGGTYIGTVASVPASKPALKTAATDPIPMTPKIMAAPAPAPGAIIIGGGVVGYQPTVGVLPVGALVDVQAWVSADLRYVNLNIHATQTGNAAIRYVNIAP